VKHIIIKAMANAHTITKSLPPERGFFGNARERTRRASVVVEIVFESEDDDDEMMATSDDFTFEKDVAAEHAIDIEILLLLFDPAL
jgi:hypothetical protein